MTSLIRIICIVVAVVLFALAAFGIGNGRMLPAGLAFLALAHLP